MIEPTKLNENKQLLSVRCIRSHEDGLTKGKVYDAHKQGEWGYDVFPDDNGYLSGWDKRFFDIAVSRVSAYFG